MLRLHRAERSSTLAVALADVLSSPLADPFATEVIAVPAKGVERWLSQQLSAVLGAVGSDGVAANIDFPSPTRLVAQAIGAASNVDADEDPWAAARLRWIVLETIDICLTEPWCAVLAKHLGGGQEGSRVGRRYATAAHLSELFARYRANRPPMLIEWAAGNDSDGAGRPLDDDLCWQAELWRRLRERIGTPSPAERLAEACARLRDEPGIVELPKRLSLFGPTRLTTEQLLVLDALAANRDVHLWLPHPSSAMWQKLTDASAVSRRADDTSALNVTHSLLASLGRDVRELQQRLARFDSSDVHHSGGEPPDTLLGRIQADVRADRPPTLDTKPDGTVQVHACHGPPRQVEILRESLLHLFEDDPSLEPRDVLVLCPDVETYAPLVRAAFGQGAVAQGVRGHPGHRLRVRLADRGLRQTNPLLDIVATMIGLADARVTASQVLDLAARGPVRRQFGFGEDDLERLREWTTESGARWGIGALQRTAFGLGDFRQNTWKTGIDRILLGVTADETERQWLSTALPLDDVDSNDIDLAGRLAEFVDCLDVVLRSLQGAQPARSWTDALSGALDLLTAVEPADAWQLAQARRELAAATEHSADLVLRLPDVRSMLADRLAGRPTRANFRTGELTVCTMVPMRSVPHRVVAVLGLDDEIFPRGPGLDGDDVLARDPCLGERDPRSEDRQLLLDALMSAGQNLLLFYTGADPVTGAHRPPAVPLGELLDVLTVMTGPTGMTQVVTRHPLQPFDPRDFQAAAPFSFDRQALAGARARQGTKVAVPTFLPTPLPPHGGDVSLPDLIAFLVHPTQAFLRQRLGVRIPQAEEDIADELCIELDGLQRWDIGDRILTARIAGVAMGDLLHVEQLRGTAPPARLGQKILDDIKEAVEAIAVASVPVHAGAPETLDVDVDLGAGRRLTGTVTGVHGSVIATTTFSTLAAKHRLSAWAKLLAVAASGHGIAASGQETAASGQAAPWQAVTTGKGPYRRPVWRSTLTAPADALEQLRRLVDLRDRGLRAPLPIATDSSHVYAERRASGDTVTDAMDAAQRSWAGQFGENTDRSMVYLYGPSPRFDQLTAESPQPDERGWGPESTRFAVLATRLWDPLLAAESVGRP